MTAGLVIPLADLRLLFESLMAHVHEVSGPEIRLENDMFWAIPSDSLYDVYNEPKDLTIGQLSESWEFLVALLAAPSANISYGLVWLADVLRAIGIAVVQ